MPTGLARVRAALDDQYLDRLPVCLILHAMGARMLGMPIGRYATDARLMADSVLTAYRHFGYDGLQLSLGVATEAEALGCATRQPEDGLPVVIEPVLTDRRRLLSMRIPDMGHDGRLPLFVDAVARVREAVGDEAWVIATIRGPLLMGSQLRGVEQMLLDLLDDPAWTQELFAFTTEVGIAFGERLVQAGAHAIAIGEATSSPDFISPALYRRHVHAHHVRLVQGLHEAGCRSAIMHICGRALPIVADVAATGSDVMDIDCQVDPLDAFGVAGPRMTLRGNIDPVSVLLYGDPGRVEVEVSRLLGAVGGRGRYILGSGCDVPADSPAENIKALMRAARHGNIRPDDGRRRLPGLGRATSPPRGASRSVGG